MASGRYYGKPVLYARLQGYGFISSYIPALYTKNSREKTSREFFYTALTRCDALNDTVSSA